VSVISIEIEAVLVGGGVPALPAVLVPVNDGEDARPLRKIRWRSCAAARPAREQRAG
jgi:hypothetical protein